LEIFRRGASSTWVFFEGVIDKIGAIGGGEYFHSFKVGVLGVWVFVAEFVVIEETFLGALE